MGYMKRYAMDVQEATGNEGSADRVFKQFMIDIVTEHDARHERDMAEHKARMAAWEAKRKKPGRIAEKESDHYSVDF